MNFREFVENINPMSDLQSELRQKYPRLDLWVWETPDRIELSNIRVPKESYNQGIGTDVVRQIQAYAQKVQKPIVIRPSPDKGKKAALDRFYRRLGFIPNKGRNLDYRLSAPFARTMYWTPKNTNVI